jgi:hypothetical protein
MRDSAPKPAYGVRNEQIHDNRSRHSTNVPAGYPDTDRGCRLWLKAGFPHAARKLRCVGEKLGTQPDIGVCCIRRNGKAAIAGSEVYSLCTDKDDTHSLLAQGVKGI